MQSLSTYQHTELGVVILSWRIKFFAELTNFHLYQILKLRQDIFILEQNCLYADADNLDQKSLHAFFVSEEHDQVVAYCRILPAGLTSSDVAIGRVVVSDCFRRQGLATKMMKQTIAFIEQEMQPESVVVSAQSHLKYFYSALGFEEVSSPYDEDGIEHIDMRLTFKSPFMKYD
jgi:ElaA protein